MKRRRRRVRSKPLLEVAGGSLGAVVAATLGALFADAMGAFVGVLVGAAVGGRAAKLALRSSPAA